MKFWGGLHDSRASREKSLERDWKEHCLPLSKFDSLLQVPRMMQTVHDFLEQFFKCHYCRRHFLKNFEAGSFGRDLAKTSRQQAGHGKFVLPISSDRGNVSVSILSPGKYYRRGFVTRRFGGDPFICTACFCLLQVVLYFWRFHNAVSVRVTAWHGCNTTDRRWPPSSVCSRRRWGFPVNKSTTDCAGTSRPAAIGGS